MKKIENIKAKAIEIGACDKIGEVKDFASLAKLFFSPQGREFCENNNFPSLAQWRGVRQGVEPFGIYVNSGDMELCNCHKVALIGKTHAKIKVSGTECVRLIILMHGATAEIEAYNYAVLKVVNISGGEVAIHNDNTTRIL